MARPASCASTITETRLISIISRSCARSSSSNGTTSAMPAFGTAMSRRPCRVSACCTSAVEVRVVAHVADLDRSRRSRPPAARARSTSRPAATTSAPAARSTRTKRSPRPRDAPVTTATRPSSRNSCVELGRHAAQGSRLRGNVKVAAVAADALRGGATRRRATAPTRRAGPTSACRPGPAPPGAEWAYFAGNSLGLQPRGAAAAVAERARRLGRARGRGLVRGRPAVADGRRRAAPVARPPRRRRRRRRWSP